jgi:hypothetical protein
MVKKDEIKFIIKLIIIISKIIRFERIKFKEKTIK